MNPASAVSSSFNNGQTLVDTPRDAAVVLHVRSYGDSDGIVTLFTLLQGRAGVFMRGLRSHKRKQTLQPLYEIALELHKRPGSELFVAQALDIVKPHLRLSEELVRLAAASAWLEAYRDLFHDGDADAAAYALLVETLDTLEREPPRVTLSRALEQLAAQVGYEAPSGQASVREVRSQVTALEQVCGHTLSAHRFFLEVAE